MDSTVDNPESRKKNGATEEGAIFTPRSVRLYKGMLIASIDDMDGYGLTEITEMKERLAGSAASSLGIST